MGLYAPVTRRGEGVASKVDRRGFREPESGSAHRKAISPMPSKQTRSAASPQRLTHRSDTVPRVPQPDLRPASTDDLDPQLVVSFVSLATCHGPDVHCGLTIVPAGGVAQTIAATDDIPVHADWLQNQQHQGPVIGPAGDAVLTSLDLAADPRWPDFGRLCVAVLDVRSLLAIEVPLRGRGRAVLAFYSREPEALDGIDVDAVLTLLPMVGSSALHHTRTALRSASDIDYSRIAAALAIVMSDQALSPAQAFRCLRDASRRSGRPLLEGALEVLAAGSMAGRQRFVGGPDMWSEHGSGPAA